MARQVTAKKLETKLAPAPKSAPAPIARKASELRAKRIGPMTQATTAPATDTKANGTKGDVPKANATTEAVKRAMIDAPEAVKIPLSSIVVDRSWNARFAVKGKRYEPVPSKDEAWGEKGEGTPMRSAAEFEASIEDRGQDTPIVVREIPGDGKKRTFALVCGFRRFEAITAIAKRGGALPYADWNPNAPYIRAEVRALNATEARALNLRENVDREKLRPVDMAFGFLDLEKTAAAEGRKITQTEMALMIGVSQGTVGLLLPIARALAPSVLNDWRESGSPVNVATMKGISTLTGVDEQEAAYKVAKGGEETREGGGGESEDKEDAKLASLKKRAAAFGKMVGALVNAGFDWESPSFDVREIVDQIARIPSGTAAEESKLQRIMAKAALKAFETETEDDEETEAEKKGSAAKKRAAAKKTN